LHLLGGVALRAGHTQAGIELLQRTVAIAPAYGEAWGSLGRALADNGDIDEAEQAFQQALAARPGHWPAESGLAAVWKAQGELVKAGDLLAKAVAVHPERAEPPFELANLLQEQGEHDGAIREYGNALARNPTLAAALSNRAAARLKVGDAKGALKDAEAYLATGARSANVVAYRVLALQWLGRWDEAHDWDNIATMVYPAVPQAEPGFGEQLEADIRAHPRLTGDWDQGKRAIRRGQVVLDLAQDPTPTIARFLEMIRAEVDGLRDRLPDQADHPFFGAKPAKYNMSVWANILSPGGQQAAHIHNYGWLSGTYYPTLPAAICDDSDAGWISFGTPGYSLPAPPDLPTRSLKPVAGSMFMFPSYLWHHTIPLESGEERISIAFDIVPA
jgi:tetratricopeptide (TPR) repeat protein